MFEIMSWSQAKRIGLKTYFNGRPCVRGHIDIRYTNCRRCRQCGRDQARVKARKKNKSVHAAEVRRWWKEHPEAKPLQLKKHRQWRKSNKDHVMQYARKHYHKNKVIPQYKLSVNLRTRLRSVIHGYVKNGSAISDLGCSVDELIVWLENKFVTGMTWKNYGPVWHVDHKRPLKSFDLTNRKQFLKACHYTNLQPLFAVDNMKKGAKYEKS